MNAELRDRLQAGLGIDPRKPLGPQIASAVGQIAFILGGPAIGLVTIRHYPFLIRDRTIYIGGLTGIAAFALASVAVVKTSSLPAGLPTPMRYMFRLGLGLAATFWLLGITGIVNGYGTRVINRPVVVVGKRQTRQRDPSRRAYYLAVRAWPPLPTVVELDGPAAVYEKVDVPLIALDTPQSQLDAMPDSGAVSLAVGQGRLGLEWLSGISR
jgi:hypothetical protein